ncbi:MAG: DUF2798 domain-containing protein [Eubacterium sp.]
MPKTKFESFIFSLIMSFTMAYGMEVYNVAIKMGYNIKDGSFSSMTNAVFLPALKEASYMFVLVFIFSNLWGSRIGHSLASKLVDFEKDNNFFVTLVMSGCTVLIMCPTMSLAAAVLFNIIMAKQSVLQLPAIWVGTVIKNFPMALLWNIFAAGPLTRLIFRKVFRR